MKKVTFEVIVEKGKKVHFLTIFSTLSNEKQERQIVARYARLTPSCKAGACTGQNSSMKTTKGTNSEIKQARVMIPSHCTPPR